MLRRARVYVGVPLGIGLLVVIGFFAQRSDATGATETQPSTPPAVLTGPVAVDSAPARPVNVSVVPQGFSLTEDQVIKDPNTAGYQEHLLHYAGKQQAFEVLVLTGAPTLDQQAELASNPGSQHVTVRGHDGVLIPVSDTSGLNIVEWMPDSGTTIKVVGRGVSDHDLLSVANGVDG